MSRMVGWVLGLAATLVGAPRLGDQFWVEYEPPNGYFPEDVGWTRYTSYGGDQRALEDGWLVMDGMADPRMCGVRAPEPMGLRAAPEPSAPW